MLALIRSGFPARVLHAPTDRYMIELWFPYAPIMKPSPNRSAFSLYARMLLSLKPLYRYSWSLTSCANNPYERKRTRATPGIPNCVVFYAERRPTPPDISLAWHTETPFFPLNFAIYHHYYYYHYYYHLYVPLRVPIVTVVGVTWSLLCRIQSGGLRGAPFWKYWPHSRERTVDDYIHDFFFPCSQNRISRSPLQTWPHRLAEKPFYRVWFRISLVTK